jgi:hypothetical protein
MRSFWLGTLAVTTAVSIGACATGSVETSPAALGNGSENTSDSGSSTSTQAANGSDDAGTVMISEDAGSAPASDDSGQTSSPTNNDSGPISPPQSDDSGVIISEDSGQPSQGEDAGAPATGASTCPDTFKYFGEWLRAPASAAVCASGSDCPTTQCCYGANVGSGLCVAL